MSEAQFDLIPMADIARLAGQSRATVGNWKLRNPENFPPERGRNSRGPLYDRGEVTTWLKATNRFAIDSTEVPTLWKMFDQLRDAVRIADVRALILLLLAVVSKAPEAEWQQLVGAATEDLQYLFSTIVHRLFPFADDIIPPGPFPAQQIAAVIEILSHIDRSQISTMAYALLDQMPDNLGYQEGYFSTPLSVRKLLVGIAQPCGTVYNPAMGTAQLLIDAAVKTKTNPQFVGQEIDRQSWAMAQLNLAIHDIVADVGLGDVFGEDHFPKLRADRIISIPPFGQKIPILDNMADDPRWIWGEPGSNNGNVAWIQHCLARLGDKGRAVIVLANNVLFEGGRAGNIRQRIIKAGLLDAVIVLPPRLFTNTAIPCSVLVFDKGRTVGAGPTPTLMIDLTEQARSTSRINTLDNDLIEQVGQLYTHWLEGKQPNIDWAAVATFDDIVNNDFIINPARYLSLPDDKPDLDEAVRVRSELTERLDSLVKISSDSIIKVKRELGNGPLMSEQVRLGDIPALSINKGFPPSRSLPEGEVSILSVPALRNSMLPRHFAQRHDLEDLQINLAQPGDVLIAIEGGTVGEVFVVPTDTKEFVASQQVATLRVTDTAGIDPWYLGAWLNTEVAQQQLGRLAQGSAIKRIPIKYLTSLNIQVPPIEQQRIIGEHFQTLETTIQSHRAMTACLEELRSIDLIMTFASINSNQITEQGKQ